MILHGVDVTDRRGPDSIPYTHLHRRIFLGQNKAKLAGLVADVGRPKLGPRGRLPEDVWCRTRFIPKDDESYLNVAEVSFDAAQRGCAACGRMRACVLQDFQTFWF